MVMFMVRVMVYLAFALTAICGRVVAQTEPTCRVSVPGGIGTGIVFERSQGYVYQLTNSHVIDNARQAKCEFWRQGHQSAPLAGEVILNAHDMDAAVIAIPEVSFGKNIPLPIPFAPRDYRLQLGQTICSAGCAGGSWPTAWRGHFLGYEQDGRIRFTPPPANGRSGSAITDTSGSMIVGLVEARSLDNSHGIGISVQQLYHALGREVRAKQRVTPTQCGLEGCPSGGCGPSAGPTPQYRLLPYRQKQQQAPQDGGNLWPTLPAPAPIPTPSPLPTPDMNDGLKAIADAIANRPVEPVQVPPSPVVPADPDPQTKSLIDANATQIKALADAIPNQVEASMKPLADKLEAVAVAVGPLVRLKEKLDADAEEGGLKGRIAQKILDKLEGSRDDADPVLKSQLVKHLAAAAAILGIIAFGVIHLIRTGRGVGGDVLAKLADRHPDNEKLQEISSKVSTLEATLSDTLRGIGVALNLAKGNTVGAAVGGATLASQIAKQVAEAVQPPTPTTPQPQVAVAANK